MRFVVAAAVIWYAAPQLSVVLSASSSWTYDRQKDLPDDVGSTQSPIEIHIVENGRMMTTELRNDIAQPRDNRRVVFGARRSSPAEQLPAEYGRFSRHERSPTEHRYDDNIIRNLMRAPLPIPNALRTSQAVKSRSRRSWKLHQADMAARARAWKEDLAREAAVEDQKKRIDVNSQSVEGWTLAKFVSKETLISFVLGGLLVLLIVLVLVAIFRRLSRGQDDTTTRGVAGESLGIECFVRVPIRVAVRSLGENQPSQPLLQLTIRNGPQPTEVVPLKPNKEA